jgi:hypothetical protein
MTNPLDDNSRWTIIGPRFETPKSMVDEFRQLIRELYGDEFADAIETTIPPPYGTLGIQKIGD